MARYQGLQYAQMTGLVKTGGNQVYLGVDYTTKIIDNGFRSSIRVESKKAWNGGLLVADFAHVPAGGCGAWPALYVSKPAPSMLFARRCTTNGGEAGPTVNAWNPGTTLK